MIQDTFGASICISVSLFPHPGGADCVKGAWKVKTRDSDCAASWEKSCLEKLDDCIICFSVCLVGKLQGVELVFWH